MHNIRKLKIWNDSIDLVIEVYKALVNMPIEEKYGLSSQIKRCAVTQLIICERLNFISIGINESLLNKLDEIQKMIFVFKENLKKNINY
ncbi:MAG: hypothetical protein DI529_06975 [Chryseobacterium sp.]|nr:MAG: hypothetical protein DI529_06975 [Chryseobacterium sp.]